MQSAYFFFLLLLFLFFHNNSISSQDMTYNPSIRLLQGLLMVLVIGVFFGIRNPNLGADSVAYLKWYKAGTPDVVRSYSEKGFELFMYILHKCLYGDKAFLFIMSFLIALIDLFFYRQISSKNFNNYLLLQLCFYYFYYFHLSMYRQAIAIGLVGISFMRYKANDKKQFLFWGVLSVLIHYTAIIFIFFPVLDKFSKKIKTKRQHLYILLILFVFFSTHIVKKLLVKIPDFSTPVHVLKSYYIYQKFGAIHLTHSHFISILIILFFHFNFNRLRNNKFFYIYLIHSLYFVCIAIFKDCVVLYDRLYFYLQIFEPVLIFEFSSLFKEKKIAKYIIYIVCILYSLFTIFIWGPRNIIKPYYF